MKKLMKLVAVSAMVLGFVGCGNKKTEMANPVHECTKDELVEKTGIELDAPADMTDVAYAYIDSESPVAQVTFKYNGTEYVYRAMATSEIIDMGHNTDANASFKEVQKSMEEGLAKGAELAGYYTKWNEQGLFDVHNRPAVYGNAKKGPSLITWFDAVPGVLYSLGTDKHVGYDELVKLADLCFVPLQD